MSAQPGSSLGAWQRFVRQYGKKYVGGDIQENGGLGVLQGPIESIAVRDGQLVVRTGWTAIQVASDTWREWNGNGSRHARLFVYNFDIDDSITPPTVDHGRVRFTFLFGEVTTFPPGDEQQLPRSRVRGR